MAFELSAVIRLNDQFSQNMKRVRESTERFSKSVEKMKSAGKSFDQFGSKLTKSITMPAMAATSALAGITTAMGFKRLIGIDTAQAKLKALGHDAASVTTIMDSALASVTGTAYGLDTAATMAASAVAAGLKPGEELTRYLSLTADAAAIAGSSMGEMGSIFNKVQTANRAYNGELQQLADRGLPIYQWLADEAGVTADAIRDMASQGQISSELFRSAIESNIGGAAKTMGEESFSAAMANIGADISRIGASFIGAGGKAGGFFATVKPLLTSFRGMLSSVEEKAVVWGEKFGEAFNNFITRIKNVKAWFDSLSPTMQSVITKTLAFGAAFAVGIGPALKIVGALMSVMGLLLNPVGLVITAIAALTAGFIYLYNTSETVRNGLATAWGFLKSTAETVFNGIKSFWAEWGGTIIQAFKDYFAIVKIVWSTVFNVIFATIKAIFGAIKVFWDNWGGTIITLLTGTWNNLKTIIETAINVISKTIGLVLSIITGDWSAAWDNIKGIFVAVWDGIKSIFGNTLSTMISIGADLFTGIWDGMKGIWSSISGWISDKVSWMTDKLMFWRKGNKEMSESNATGPAAAIDGSHFGGLWRVPFDGYLAKLHKGERVLTAREAGVYDGFSYDQAAGKTVNTVTNTTVNNVSKDRSSKSAGPSGFNITINEMSVRQESDIEEIADKLLRKIKFAWKGGA